MLIKKEQKTEMWSNGRNILQGILFVFLTIVSAVGCAIVAFVGTTGNYVPQLIQTIILGMVAYFFLKERKFIELIIDTNNIEVYKKNKNDKSIPLEQIKKIFLYTSGNRINGARYIKFVYNEDENEKEYMFLISLENYKYIEKVIKEYKKDIEIIKPEELTPKKKIIVCCIIIPIIVLCIIGLCFKYKV